MPPYDLPPLDLHAHIAPDVTAQQASALRPAVVFSMTRSLAEAKFLLRNEAPTHPGLVWGIGAHPGIERSLTQFDEAAFREMLPRFAIVGEVGLDKRGDQGLQLSAFRKVLRSVAEEPLLVSVHSAGRCTAVLDEIAALPHPGMVLHWFNGTPAEIDRAAELGCYFSVNAAMPDEVLRTIPPDRLLTETDFPSLTKRTGASKPGDVLAVEAKLDSIHGVSAREVAWHNLGEVARNSGAIERFPAALRTQLARP